MAKRNGISQINVFAKTICVTALISELALASLIIIVQKQAWGDESAPISALLVILGFILIWQTYKVILALFSGDSFSSASQKALILIAIGFCVGNMSLLINFLGGPHALVSPLGLIIQIFFIHKSQKNNKPT